MDRTRFSVNGALAGALGGWVAEVVIQEITGHHIISGVLEVLGAAAGLWRLDKRLYEVLQNTLAESADPREEDYRQVKRRIEELTQDLPELREILGNMVDAGIQAQRA